MKAKQTAQQIAKQIAREPLEILKEVPKQVVSQPEKKEELEKAEEQEQTKNSSVPDERVDKFRAQRLSTALEEELKDIKRQKVFEEIERRVSQGEDVNIGSYPELTIEQKQVLAAQNEALKIRRTKESRKDRGLVEPRTKQKRGLFAGIKTHLKRLAGKSEIRLPPSG